MFQNDTSAKAQEMSDFQKAMGANMYEAYIDYFNALGLTVDGVSYELSEDGRSGSFYDFLLEQYGASYSVYAAKNNLRLDGNVLAIDDSNAGFVALSRANGFANAQQAIGKPAQGYAVVTESDAIYKQLSGSYSAGTYSGETLSNLKTEQSKKYSLSDLYTTDADGSKLYEYDFDNDIKTMTGAVDFDDPRWETLLAQMSVDEMQMLIGRGGWQTAREIYLKAYEQGVKSGDLPGLMMSYMWINGDWCGASSSLLTGIVRNEWGFDGMITTDNAGVGGGVKWMEPARILNAGGDMVLNATLMKLPDSFKNSDEGLSAMKTASKHILYTYASASLNRLEAMRVGENRFVPLFIGLNVLLYGAAIACGIVYVAKRKRARARCQSGAGTPRRPRRCQAGSPAAPAARPGSLFRPCLRGPGEERERSRQREA